MRLNTKQTNELNKVADSYREIAHGGVMVYATKIPTFSIRYCRFLLHSTGFPSEVRECKLERHIFNDVFDKITWISKSPVPHIKRTYRLNTSRVMFLLTGVWGMLL